MFNPKHSKAMKKLLVNMFALIAAMSLGATAATAQYADDYDYDYMDDSAYDYDDQYMGDYAYDEQQWWNPGDWFDDTVANWDYDNEWFDYDWYEDRYDYGVGGYEGYESEGEFGTSEFEDDYDTYDQTWDDYDWYDDFDYDLDF